MAEEEEIISDQTDIYVPIGIVASTSTQLNFDHSSPYCSCLGIFDDDREMNSIAARYALSFSGCGFLGVYHFGSIACFGKHGKHILKRTDRFAGASAGSLVAAVLVTCPDKIQDCLAAWYTVAEEIVQKPFGALNPDYSLIKRVEQYIDGILPIDAHKLANGRLFISVTNRSEGLNCVVSEFGSRELLLKYLVSSCYIPFYAGANCSPPLIDGLEYIDGGFSTNLPKFDDRRTITISPFSGEADISPEDVGVMFDWKFTFAKQVVKVPKKFVMPLLTVITKRFLSLIHCIMASFKRLLCFMGRKRVHGEGDLPFTIQQAATTDNASEFEGWDTWGDNRKRQKTESEQRIEAYRHRLSTAREEMEKAAATETGEENHEINYFESLQPEIKPVKKIVLKPKFSGGPSDMPSSMNRFAVQSDINVYMSNVDNPQLGDLDEMARPMANNDDAFGPWDVDETSLDVDSVLKEARHKERQQRLEEQRRKKMEKQRFSKQSLEAVKLS